jgi:hypothetical protein
MYNHSHNLAFHIACQNIIQLPILKKEGSKSTQEVCPWNSIRLLNRRSPPHNNSKPFNIELQGRLERVHEISIKLNIAKYYIRTSIHVKFWQAKVLSARAESYSCIETNFKLLEISDFTPTERKGPTQILAQGSIYRIQVENRRAKTFSL